MMFSKTQIATLLLAAPLACAFGPAAPLINGQQNGQSMTMRVSMSDMKNRGKVTTMLDHVVNAGDPVATKEAIATTVVTEETSSLLAKMGWRPRDAMIRKVKSMAYDYDVPVAADFGLPVPQLEREALEAAASVPKKAAKKAHFEAVIKERDERVAARRAAEAGSDADKKKKAAVAEAELAKASADKLSEEKAEASEALRLEKATFDNASEAAEEDAAAAAEAAVKHGGKAAE